jgi:phosphatidylserine/phosphatidylglycerophosphate/cardiolipin synthase-like enzyme
MSTTSKDNERTGREVSTVNAKSDLVLNTAYLDRLISEIKKAKYEIRICAYAWRWYTDEPELAIQKFNVALLQQRLYGVKVRILCDTLATCAIFKAQGFDVRAVERAKTLHTKAVCIDHGMLVIGSHNLTKRASIDNYEMSIFTSEFEAIAQFRQCFDQMWGAYA